MNGRLISVSIIWRKLNLGLFRRFLQPLQRHAVLTQVDVVLFLNSPISQSTIRWSISISTQVCIAVVDFTSTTPAPTSSTEISNVAAAEVVDRDRFVALLVQPIR